jgi:hypothetical protein
MDCEMDKIMLKSIAVQKVSTVKPPTILEQSKMMSAFTTKRNNPKVTTVTGNVKNTSNGLINVLSNPNTNATIIEVIKLETVMPDMK